MHNINNPKYHYLVCRDKTLLSEGQFFINLNPACAYMNIQIVNTSVNYLIYVLKHESYVTNQGELSTRLCDYTLINFNQKGGK